MTKLYKKLQNAVFLKQINKDVKELVMHSADNCMGKMGPTHTNMVSVKLESQSRDNLGAS